MLETVRGLVLRSADYGDQDKLLTVLTPGGIRLVTAKGAHGIKSRYLAAAQPMCYCEFTLDKKNEYYWLREASLIENFFNIRQDICRYALALYICEVGCGVCMEDNDEQEMLSLLLNTLYMLSLGKLPDAQVKATFELRAAVTLGFCPNLSGCEVCGKGFDPRMYLDVMNGVLRCSSCFGTGDGEDTDLVLEEGTATIVLPLEPMALETMRYVCFCQPKRIYSHYTDPSVLPDFAKVCETYLLNHLERGFKTLTFYKSIVSEEKAAEKAAPAPAPDNAENMER